MHYAGDISQHKFGSHSIYVCAIVIIPTCEVDVTCDANGNKLPGDFEGVRIRRDIYDRQTGEDFQSEGPPECRTINVCNYY